ncbi:hypothetical protein [Streptomyces beigongshangae]|uniref:hypothetical protein n=1 Tax=Streptomyces beigongshangae TaxID=2841597 RepID=UPI001C85DF81|nr:hypothetical protein [Streptomyces sp. REN17]
MSDNTATGPFRDERDQAGGRGDVTRTPGTGGTVRAGSDDRAAAQERAREGRDTMVDGERIPAGPVGAPGAPGSAGAAGHDRSPAGEGLGKGAGAGRSGASREGLRGAEARVNAGAGAGTGGRLMRDEGDKWSLRLQQAVAAFVDGPRGSVEEADEVLKEVTERFVDAVAHRQRTLRTSWQGSGDGKADTEQLRLALKDYRELTERLLKL